MLFHAVYEKNKIQDYDKRHSITKIDRETFSVFVCSSTEIKKELSPKDAAAVRETKRVTYSKLVTEYTRAHATIHSRTIRVYPDVIIVCQATLTPFPGWNPDSELPFQAKTRSHI
ncbi:hypothetical protein EVAR_73690_1 [Eumeta japonica]|uniref:Uncharacterized protein n=1 Tax=Eumeta variegata TaxID=151549 RepID=A0A4C1T7W7_EUMVA|nr:hypothetical protein EVAR_73690_1 [Eumeta japonica]